MAVSRCTRTSSAWNERRAAWRSAHAARPRRRSTSSGLKGVGEQKRDVAADARHRHGARSAHHLPAAVGRPHQRGPHRRPRGRAGGAGAGRGALGAQADDAQPAHDGRAPWSATAAGGCTWCSSTSRGASASSRPGLQVALFGKAEAYRGGLQMTNPIVDLIGDRTGRIVPIYPQSEKARSSTWELAGWVENALRALPPARHRRPGARVGPPAARADRPRRRAARAIHLPETIAEKEQARRRLAFDELLRVQTSW